MNRKLFVLCLLVYLTSAKRTPNRKSSKDDIVSSLTKYETDKYYRQILFQEIMIETAGFKSEVHLVETEDGYILKVHRIKKANGNTKTVPVFFMHGLTATAADYIRTGPEIALRKSMLF